MIADIIRKLRMERNLTQEYIAHELDISQNAYCKIENGQVNITVDRLEKIAAILETPMVVLFQDVDPRPVTEAVVWQEMKNLIILLQDELHAKQKVVDNLMDIIHELRNRHSHS
jgi:transcriptional regulator with XRE-family HTH domain